LADYVNNKKMLAAFVEHRGKVAKAREAGEPDPRLSDYIGTCFWMIAENLGRKPSYSGYSYIEEMKGDGIENCIVAANNFDPAKSSNPFAYFTQIIKWAFHRRIEKESRQTYIKYKAYQNMNVSGDLYSGDEEEFRSKGQSTNDVADEIVYRFEENKRQRDLRAKENKKIKKGIEVLFDEEQEDVLDQETREQLSLQRTDIGAGSNGTKKSSGRKHRGD
jgi:hypothetical protein